MSAAKLLGVALGADHHERGDDVDPDCDCALPHLWLDVIRLLQCPAGLELDLLGREAVVVAAPRRGHPERLGADHRRDEA